MLCQSTFSDRLERRRLRADLICWRLLGPHQLILEDLSHPCNYPPPPPPLFLSPPPWLHQAINLWHLSRHRTGLTFSFVHFFFSFLFLHCTLLFAHFPFYLLSHKLHQQTAVEREPQDIPALMKAETWACYLTWSKYIGEIEVIPGRPGGSPR